MTGVWIDQMRLHWRRPPAASMPHWPSRTRLIELPNALVRVRDVAAGGAGGRTILLTPDAPVVLENYDRLIELMAPARGWSASSFPAAAFLTRASASISRWMPMSASSAT